MAKTPKTPKPQTAAQKKKAEEAAAAQEAADKKAAEEAAAADKEKEQPKPASKAKGKRTTQRVKVPHNFEGDDVVVGDTIDCTKEQEDSMRARGLIH